MDDYGIRDAVESIRMPRQVRCRIAGNLQKRKENTMRKHTRKFITAAAILALCLCLPLGVGAAGRLGQFRDLLGFGGAVVGTAYDNATEEIQVSAVRESGTIVVNATLLEPGKAPYCYAEQLCLGSWYLTDAQGRTVARGSGEDSAAPITGSRVRFCIEAPSEARTLHISSFVSRKKADQDLTISGTWECPLTP